VFALISFCILTCVKFHPLVADYVEPYVIGLLSRYVEIRTISPRALIQSIELPKPRYITQGKHLYVASTSHVWRLLPVSIPMQIQQLLQDKQFSLALMLAVSVPLLRVQPKYKSNWKQIVLDWEKMKNLRSSTEKD